VASPLTSPSIVCVGDGSPHWSWSQHVSSLFSSCSSPLRDNDHHPSSATATLRPDIEMVRSSLHQSPVDAVISMSKRWAIEPPQLSTFSWTGRIAWQSQEKYREVTTPQICATSLVVVCRCHVGCAVGNEGRTLKTIH
jgi:hypothetical protein